MQIKFIRCADQILAKKGGLINSYLWLPFILELIANDNLFS